MCKYENENTENDTELYAKACWWLLFFRRLESACVYAALGLSVVPLLGSLLGAGVSAVLPWLSVAVLATAVTSDILRGVLATKADYHHERLNRHEE